MKRIFASSILLGSILLTGCGMVQTNQTYIQKVEESPTLQDQAEYFRANYQNASREDAYWGYKALLEGGVINLTYESVLASIEKDNTRMALLGNLKKTETAVLNQISMISSNWGEAINYGVKSKYSNYTFSQALARGQYEYKRLGVYDNLSSIKSALREAVSELDKQAYPETFELYGIVSQLMELAERPTGSMQSYSNTVMSLKNNFNKTFSLAELEL